MRLTPRTGLALAAAGLLSACVAAEPPAYYMPAPGYSGFGDRGARYPGARPYTPSPAEPPYALPQPAPTGLPAYDPPPPTLEPPPRDDPPPPAYDPPPPATSDPAPADDLPLPVPDSRGDPKASAPVQRPGARTASPNNVPLMGFRPMKGQQGL